MAISDSGSLESHPHWAPSPCTAPTCPRISQRRWQPKINLFIVFRKCIICLFESHVTSFTWAKGLEMQPPPVLALITLFLHTRKCSFMAYTFSSMHLCPWFLTSHFNSVTGTILLNPLCFCYCKREEARTSPERPPTQYPLFLHHKTLTNILISQSKTTKAAGSLSGLGDCPMRKAWYSELSNAQAIWWIP